MRAPLSPALFDQFARGWRGYVLIALIALISGSFGAAHTPVWDVDEARFAQASRQMAESGDHVRIRLQDQERNNKPIGAYWAQAASAEMFLPLTGRLNTIWPYRAPSILALALAAIATMWGGAALLGQRTAFIGAGLFASGMLAGFESATARADALLLGFTTLAMAALARLYAQSHSFSLAEKVAAERPDEGRADTQAPDRWRAPHPPPPSPQGRGRAYALTFWAALACGMLIKGPITPLVALLALAALAFWEKRWDWMRPLLWWPGPALALLLAAPWFIAISQATQGRFLADMIFGDIAPKILSGDEGHFAPPGLHTLLLPLFIFPATFALPAAARLALDAIRAHRSDSAAAAHRFLLAWAVTAFLVFELAPTKLPHYPLPAYPALCLLCGAGLMAMRGRRWRTAHPAGLVFFAVAGAALVALTAAGSTLMPGDFAADFRRAVSTALIGAAIVTAACVALVALRRPTTRAAVLIACALALSFNLRERLIPEAHALFVSDEAVAALTRARLLPNDNRRLWVVGFRETSIVFLTRTSTRLADPQAAAAGAAAGDAMLIEGRVLDQTEAALAARGLAFTPAEPPARGFALSSFRRVALFAGKVDVSGEPEDGPQRNR